MCGGGSGSTALFEVQSLLEVNLSIAKVLTPVSPNGLSLYQYWFYIFKLSLEFASNKLCVGEIQIIPHFKMEAVALLLFLIKT